MKRYEEIKNLITGQGEDHTTGCLLDYDYIKINCGIIEVDFSRKKELDADRIAIQQIKFVGQLRNPDNAIVADESMFVLTILEKIKETRLKFSQESVKLSRSESYTNKCTTKLIKICSKKLRITRKNFKIKNCLMNYF